MGSLLGYDIDWARTITVAIWVPLLAAAGYGTWFVRAKLFPRTQVQPARPAQVAVEAPARDPVRAVVVVDIRMPFDSMVRFMVMWVLAAIPAFLILMLLGAGFFSFVSLLNKP